jgi:serine/threonine-protein kinase
MNSGSLPSPYPAPGEVIDGKYQIDRILGEGGMGCVARAYHLILQKAVALKFMNPQFMNFPGAVERFLNEGVASGRIRNAHVVPVTETGKLPSGAPYLVMECLAGMDLADLLARDGTPGLPTPRAIHFTLQILRGLQAAHAAGIIHRDMKPSNCFVVKHDGEDDFIRILDFGISKVQQPGQSASLTQTNSALGTPLYMSPEQARSPRDVDFRSDLYSCGVILYELLSGHTPFFSESGEFTEILFKLFTEDAPPVKSTRPDLPDDLAAAVHKALSRDVATRFTDSLDMAEALAKFGDERSNATLARMRAFKPEQAVSMPPPTDMMLPASMVAFSALDARPATDLMANRPTTDVMKGAPVTEVLDNRPGPKQKTELLVESGRMSAAPEAVEARARPDEAGLKTQFHSADVPVARPVIPGVSTDLSGSRDTTAATPQPEPRRSPMAFIMLAAALAAIAGGGGFVVYKISNKPAPTVATSAPPPPVTSEIPSAKPPASATTPPSAASSATEGPSATVSATTKKTPPPPNTNKNTSSGSALDPNFH